MSLKYNIKNDNITTNIFFSKNNTRESLDDIKTILENNVNLNIYSNDSKKIIHLKI
jgi:hypothetical protein